ncbi:MAG: hypothetical protein J6D26_07580 [Clostridia bacterium]|nr:hypothetical protein [Clostridia bacterium]
MAFIKFTSPLEINDLKSTSFKGLGKSFIKLKMIHIFSPEDWSVYLSTNKYEFTTLETIIKAPFYIKIIT